MKFGLENISRLCAALGHPERAFASVIVAGTNGKGSVTAMVHRALVAAGHRSARYTSPHLERIEERFVIGDREVDPAQLWASAGRIRDAVETLQRAGSLAQPPTFFECTTAIAFDLFRAAGVRIAILEVGLGGRLDATNVVTPIAAAITSIGFDHQALLGDTLASIAFEKAGVIKPGVPVVCGALPAEAQRVVFDVCRERHAPLVFAAEGCGEIETWTGGAPPSLAGAHQRRNAAVAICLLRQIDALGLAVGDEAICTGVTDAAWPGRLERFQYAGADLLLDAAHNPDGAEALAAHLQALDWRDVALVFGAVQDKDVSSMLRGLAPCCAALFCTTPQTPRAIAADRLARIAADVPGASWTISAIDDPERAMASAAARFPRVVVAGSIFLIGPLRGILRPR